MQIELNEEEATVVYVALDALYLTRMEEFLGRYRAEGNEAAAEGTEHSLKAARAVLSQITAARERAAFEPVEGDDTFFSGQPYCQLVDSVQGPHRCHCGCGLFREHVEIPGVFRCSGCGDLVAGRYLEKKEEKKEVPEADPTDKETVDGIDPNARHIGGSDLTPIADAKERVVAKGPFTGSDQELTDEDGPTPCDAALPIRHVAGPYEPDKDWQKCSRCGMILRLAGKKLGTMPEGPVVFVGGRQSVTDDPEVGDCVGKYPFTPEQEERRQRRLDQNQGIAKYDSDTVEE